MLEKMKTALSALSVVAVAYMPKPLKEALLEMAQKIDQLERENAHAKLANSIAVSAMLENPDCPDEVRAIVNKMLAVSEGRDHG